MRRAMDRGLPVATVEVFRGRRLESAVIPVSGGTSERFVVYISRFGLYLPRQRTDDQKVGAALRVMLETAEWGPLSVLTRRELEILRLVAQGLDNPDIAKRIHRTKRAVEWHVHNLYEHLACANRTELFRHGLLAGLHDIDDTHWESMMALVRLGTGPEN